MFLCLIKFISKYSEGQGQHWTRPAFEDHWQGQGQQNQGEGRPGPAHGQSKYVKMGFGVLWSRPEVRSCGGEGSYGVTWKCGVGWSCRVEWRSGVGGGPELRRRSRVGWRSGVQRCGVTVYGVGFRTWLKLS